MMTNEEFDRNQAAMAFAAMAHAFGWQMGFQWIVDDQGKDTDKVMLFVDTPWGVFRWELSPHEMLGSWKEYTGRIPDQHNDNLRRIRLTKMIEALTAMKRDEPKPEVEETPTPQTPENVPDNAPKINEVVGPTPRVPRQRKRRGKK